MRYTVSRIGAEKQAPCFIVALNQRCQARFKKWDLPVFQVFYFLCIYIDTQNFMPNFSKNRRLNKSDVTDTKNCYFHQRIPICYFKQCKIDSQIYRNGLYQFQPQVRLQRHILH
ncbi:hypothetical protein SRABI106_02992 [Rahnella aquatilis]|nr:hypothetical protein SRABI106_02992 [Rahnella aquatilis]